MTGREGEVEGKRRGEERKRRGKKEGRKDDDREWGRGRGKGRKWTPLPIPLTEGSLGSNLSQQMQVGAAKPGRAKQTVPLPFPHRSWSHDGSQYLI